MATNYTKDEKTWGTLAIKKDKKGDVLGFETYYDNDVDNDSELKHYAEDFIDNMGANPNAKIDDWSMLEMSVISGSPGMTSALLVRGADPNGRKSVSSPTSLIRLVDYLGKKFGRYSSEGINSSEALSVLINWPDTDLDCIVSSKKSKGKSEWKSAMRSAIETHNFGVVKDLCEAGARVECSYGNEKVDYCKLAIHETANIYVAKKEAADRGDYTSDLEFDLSVMREMISYLQQKKEEQNKGKTDIRKNFRVTERGANEGYHVSVKGKGENLEPVLSSSKSESSEYTVVPPELPRQKKVGRIKKAMAALAGKETNVNYEVTGKEANLSVNPNVIKNGKGSR